MPRIILLFIACLFFSTSLLAEAKSTDKETAIIQTLTELAKEIPERYLSLDGVAEYHNYEAKKIIPWIAKNIKYSPSVGYQLTAKNTLNTLSGNALEQAVLLQDILTQAGFEVRISKTTLDDATAIRLLKQSFIQSPAKKWILDDTIRNQYLKKMSVLYGKKEDELLKNYQKLSLLTPWQESKVFKEAKALSKQLYKAVEKEKAWKFSDNAIQPWIDIAKEYYFIKYRLSQGNKWQQAHPAFVDNPPKIEKSTYFTDDIKNQYHQISLQAFITRKLGGKKETVAVTPLVKRHSQALFSHQLELVTVPTNIEKLIKADSLDLFYESQSFLPTIDGKIIDGTRIFDRDGLDYAAKDIFDPSHKLASTINKQAKNISSALTSLDKPKTDKSVEKVSSELLDYYIKIIWKSPNGDSREIKRMIYQKNSELAKASVTNDITQRIYLAAEPAVLSPAVLFKKQVTAQMTVFDLLKKSKQENSTNDAILRKITHWLSKRKDPRFNTTLALSQLNKAGHQFFSKAPMLALTWERNDDEKQSKLVSSTFDYLINSAQVATLSDKQLSMASSATVAYGVWSTYSEAFIQATKILKPTDLSKDKLPEVGASSAKLFNQSIKDNHFIISKNPASLSQLNNVTKSLLTEEAANNPNYLYIIPSKTLNKDKLAYYKVDVRTGEILGFSYLARGSASVEYAGLQITIASAITTSKFASCKEDGGFNNTCILCGIAQGATEMVLIAISGGVLAGAVAGGEEFVCNLIGG